MTDVSGVVLIVRPNGNKYWQILRLPDFKDTYSCSKGYLPSEISRNRKWEATGADSMFIDGKCVSLTKWNLCLSCPKLNAHSQKAKTINRWKAGTSMQIPRSHSINSINNVTIADHLADCLMQWKKLLLRPWASKCSHKIGFSGSHRLSHLHRY